jgi:hypothetical protein
MTQAIEPMDLGHKDAAAINRRTGRAVLQVIEAAGAVAAGRAALIVRIAHDLGIQPIGVDPIDHADLMPLTIIVGLGRTGQIPRVVPMGRALGGLALDLKDQGRMLLLDDADAVTVLTASD